MRREYLQARDFVRLLAANYANEAIRQEAASRDTKLGAALAQSRSPEAHHLLARYWSPVKAQLGIGFRFEVGHASYAVVRDSVDWQQHVLDGMTDAILDSEDFLAEIIREVALGLRNPDYRVTTKGGVGMRPPHSKRGFR